MGLAILQIKHKKPIFVLQSTIMKISNPENHNWQQAAENISPPDKLFINGEFVDAIDGERLAIINPATGDTVVNIACGNHKDIEKAVAAAAAAHKSGVWRHLPPRKRAAIMQRFADNVKKHAETLALLETLSMGKPIAQAYGGDIPEVVKTLRFFAESIDKVEGKVTSTRRDVLHYVLREPLGVVGAISPWNYPALMATWKFAPALAAGNTVVLKPAEQAPLSCLLMGQLFSEAGGPDGVFNVVAGLGETAGQALARHNDVAKISFTGSTDVGKKMLIYAGESNMKKVGLECGGKSPQIFLDDLPDMNAAIDAAVSGIFSNAGQVCNAGSRLLVAPKLHDVFAEKFIAAAAAYRPGDPLSWQTELGPLVTHADQKRVLSCIDAGVKDGAKIVMGGDAPDNLSAGAFVNPTLMIEAPRESDIAKREVFGPVAALLKFDDLDDALALANDSVYGLAAAIWTRDISRAHRAARELESGVVWINSFHEDDMTQPFGGYKQSGNARDKCFDSLLEYTQMKSVWVDFG